MITFNEGDSLATTLSGCASIPTTVDDVLEGPHSFFVNISDIRPDGALTVGTPDITEVTINDLNGKLNQYYMLSHCTYNVFIKRLNVVDYPTY